MLIRILKHAGREDLSDLSRLFAPSRSLRMTHLLKGDRAAVRGGVEWVCATFAENELTSCLEKLTRKRARELVMQGPLAYIPD